jgi:hypothetical protein
MGPTGAPISVEVLKPVVALIIGLEWFKLKIKLKVTNRAHFRLFGGDPGTHVRRFQKH